MHHYNYSDRADWINNCIKQTTEGSNTKVLWQEQHVNAHPSVSKTADLTTDSKHIRVTLVSGLTCTGGDCSHVRVNIRTDLGVPHCLQMGHRCCSALPGAMCCLWPTWHTHVPPTWLSTTWVYVWVRSKMLSGLLHDSFGHAHCLFTSITTLSVFVSNFPPGDRWSILILILILISIS